MTEESVDVESKVGMDFDEELGRQESEVIPASCPTRRASNVIENFCDLQRRSVRRPASQANDKRLHPLSGLHGEGVLLERDLSTTLVDVRQVSKGCLEGIEKLIAEEIFHHVLGALHLTLDIPQPDGVVLRS
jgi:hypothetical protein